MKKNFSKARKWARIIGLTAMLVGCGNSMFINGTEYQTFGLANQEVMRDPKIAYEMSFGSVIVAFIFFETVIIPIYVVGWDLYQPVGLKKDWQKQDMVVVPRQ